MLENKVSGYLKDTEPFSDCMKLKTFKNIEAIAYSPTLKKTVAFQCDTCKENEKKRIERNIKINKANLQREKEYERAVTQKKNKIKKRRKSFREESESESEGSESEGSDYAEYKKIKEARVDTIEKPEVKTSIPGKQSSRITSIHPLDVPNDDGASAHEKIGISNSIICFGDSNHRISEITHAGIHICFRALNAITKYWEWATASQKVIIDDANVRHLKIDIAKDVCGTKKEEKICGKDVEKKKKMKLIMYLIE